MRQHPDCCALAGRGGGGAPFWLLPICTRAGRRAKQELDHGRDSIFHTSSPLFLGEGGGLLGDHQPHKPGFQKAPGGPARPPPVDPKWDRRGVDVEGKNAYRHALISPPPTFKVFEEQPYFCYHSNAPLSPSLFRSGFFSPFKKKNPSPSLSHLFSLSLTYSLSL